MNAIILAGGKGTRMKEISDSPKVLLPVHGKPILEHAIFQLVNCGAKQIFITLSEGHTLLDRWIENSLFSKYIEIVKDKPSTHGNSYGIIESMKISNQITLLAYGDTIFDLPIKDMLSYHLKNQNDVTVLVRPTDHPIDSDLAWTSNGSVCFSKYPHNFVDFTEKLGVSAFYIIEPAATKNVNCNDFSDWFGIVQHLNNSGKKIGIFELKKGYINDLGTPLRYNNFLNQNKK